MKLYLYHILTSYCSPEELLFLDNNKCIICNNYLNEIFLSTRIKRFKYCPKCKTKYSLDYIVVQYGATYIFQLESAEIL